MQEHINPLCKQNFPNQFWMQGMPHIVYTPLAEKGKLENSVSQRSLLHLRVNMKNLNAWPTVYEKDELLYFLLSTKMFLKMFLTFLYHTDLYNLCSCHLWKFSFSSDYCSEAQIHSKYTTLLTSIKPLHCWIETEQCNEKDNAMQQEK